VVAGAEVHVLRGVSSLLSLLGDDGARLVQAADRAMADPEDVLPLSAVRLRAPVPVPPSIRDFYAFEQHVKTSRAVRGMDMDPLWYELPVFYFSNPHAVLGPCDPVAAPHGSAALDYELEVAAVVGRGGSDISPARGEAHIAGFTIMNDWSARDLQAKEMQLLLGPAKGKDFATSLGPFLVTPDELDGWDLAMTATVNGEEWSRGNLADLHWGFGEMVAYASRGARVAPGDVIGSGTCGTGCILELSLVHGADRYPWLRPGDVVELSVDRLGALQTAVISRQ
jgi:2-keto-4-pentenoate hydratase/2-oxohepta-3-ene-1,7-dioic acid hydratase in catechol pathway